MPPPAVSWVLATHPRETSQVFRVEGGSSEPRSFLSNCPLPARLGGGGHWGLQVSVSAR